MIQGFAELLAAAVAFAGGHLVLCSLPIRGALVARLGENGFRIGFSVYAGATLLWLAVAYNAAPHAEIWAAGGTWLRWIPVLVMPVAAVFAAAGLVSPNPTMAGAEGLAHSTAPVQGFIKVTRHPFLWGVALWAATHMAVRGNAADLVFFGAFLFLALAGMVHLDRKKARTLGAAWGPIAMTTSAIPFLALIQGRTRVTLAEIGLWRIVLGLALHVALLYAHRFVFGVSPLPG